MGGGYGIGLAMKRGGAQYSLIEVDEGGSCWGSKWRIEPVISPSHSLPVQSLLIGTVRGSLTFVRLFCELSCSCCLDHYCPGYNPPKATNTNTNNNQKPSHGHVGFSIRPPAQVWLIYQYWRHWWSRALQSLLDFTYIWAFGIFRISDLSLSRHQPLPALLWGPRSLLMAELCHISGVLYVLWFVSPFRRS